MATRIIEVSVTRSPKGRTAENGTVRLNILMQACVVVFTKIMDTHDERGETCAPRAGKALAGCRCSAAVRAAAGSLFHRPALLPLLANPAALQAILAAYSPPAGQGAGTPATSSTLVCLVCKKAGKTGKALQHLYRACELLKDKSPEEKGKIIEEAREHFGKSPSRYAPGARARARARAGAGATRPTSAPIRASPPPPSAPRLGSDPETLGGYFVGSACRATWLSLVWPARV